MDDEYRRVVLRPPTGPGEFAVVPTTVMQTITFPDGSGYLLGREDYIDLKSLLDWWRANRQNP